MARMPQSPGWPDPVDQPISSSGWGEKKKEIGKKAPRSARWPPASYHLCASRVGSCLEASLAEGRRRICRCRAQCPWAMLSCRDPAPSQIQYGIKDAVPGQIQYGIKDAAPGWSWYAIEDAAPGQIRYGIEDAAYGWTPSRLTGMMMSWDPGDPCAAAPVGARGKGGWGSADRHRAQTLSLHKWLQDMAGPHPAPAAQQKLAPRDLPVASRHSMCPQSPPNTPSLPPTRHSSLARRPRLSSTQKHPNLAGFGPNAGLSHPHSSLQPFSRHIISPGLKLGCDIRSSPSPF